MQAKCSKRRVLAPDKSAAGDTSAWLRRSWLSPGQCEARGKKEAAQHSARQPSEGSATTRPGARKAHKSRRLKTTMPASGTTTGGVAPDPDAGMMALSRKRG